MRGEQEIKASCSRVICATALLLALIETPSHAQTPIATIASLRQHASWVASDDVVRVRATVTLRDDVRDLTFVQDATGGLFVTASQSGPALSAGQAVEVAGTAILTRRGPAITNARFTLAGTSAPPQPRRLTPLDGRLMAADARLVAAEGVVRSVQTRGAGLEVSLETIDGSFTLLPPPGARPELTPVDSVVEVQGVLSHLVAEDRSPERREILAPSPASVRIVTAPATDPYATAETPVDVIRRRPPGTELVRRVKVSGVVTRQRPGRSLHLRTATQPIRIESVLDTLLVPGDRVEAIGFPEVDGHAPFLADASFRRVEPGPPPEPVVSTLAELMGGARDAELVRVDGTFLEAEQGAEDYTLVIREGDVIFNALVSSPVAALELRQGQRVQLTGICSVIVDSDRVPRLFRLQLRNAADVTILSAVPLAGPNAPWWAWVSAALAVAAIGVAVSVYRRGQDQENTIRRQIARESALKARFDDLFERSSEIMIVHDRRGSISTINRAGEQATGYSREELRMLDPGWIVGSQYLDMIARMIAEGAESPPRSFRSELVPRKGARVPVDVQARVLVGDGQIVGVTSIARDSSERDRLENELRQAQKMEAVGRLATGIAHDFNNLITVLLGYSDELIEQLPADSKWQHPALEIRRAAERASGLTQQLLAFSRRQDTVAHAVDLTHVVADMEELVRRLLGPEIRLEFSLEPELATIRADEPQIGQVLMNLVVNARDAMPRGGTLTIETANVDLGSENLDVIPGPHVSLSVRDTGVGMSPEVRNRLFEPFFTTKESGQGTGLGLSMVYGIVRQSGGQVVVESTPGRGSTFHVYFPKLEGETGAPAPVFTPSGPRAVKGEGVVLLAEDDRSVRRLVVAELGRRGFTVLDAEDGQAALDLLVQHKDEVDLLVADIVMPRMNGADLAREADKIRPGIKVLFISGHPDRAGTGVDPTGATNLLMKPFTADTLAARIKELITGKTEADGWGD